MTGVPFLFYMSFRFFRCTHTFTVYLVYSLSAESSESLYHRPPLGMSRKCMCGGNDHLAWKHLVSSETCRRLCTTEGYDRSY